MEINRDRNWKKIGIWLLLILLVTPYLIYLAPQYLGMGAYIVESGSMAPEMPKGSIVYEEWQDPRGYEEGDVVIFRPNSSEIDEDLVVHRIIDVEEGNYTNYFQTQGDANAEPDPGRTPGYNIIGERNFWIPYLGYYIIFTSSRPVLYLLILLPSAIIIKSQLENIFEELEDEKEQREEGEKPGKDRVPLKTDRRQEQEHWRTYNDQ